MPDNQIRLRHDGFVLYCGGRDAGRIRRDVWPHRRGWARTGDGAERLGRGLVGEFL